MQIDVSPEGLRALLEPKHGSLVNLKWHPIEYLSASYVITRKDVAKLKNILSLSIVPYSKNHLPRRHSFEEPDNFSAYRPPL